MKPAELNILCRETQMALHNATEETGETEIWGQDI